ncbi:MAG: PilZ domain-containing protein [Mariprofundaceae bacterium]|nr:PilZ domain-containing protein [Mariprofundaceae bacterium]
MAEQDDGNRRQDFRVDDLLPMQDKPVDEAAFEYEMRHIGIRSRQSSLLRTMVGNDIFANMIGADGDDSDITRALGALDAKLNYLIGVNMLNDANRNDLDERPVNLSVTGISFASTESYNLGDRLEVTLMLPSLPPLVMELLGTVKRVEPAPRGQVYVGALFNFRCDDEQEQLARYVFRRHREMIRLESREREAALE